MKKILVSLLCVLLLTSCIKSQKSSSVREVRITNESSYELVFTDIDNGGDPTFWPQTSFTLKPHEEYSQFCYNISKNTPYRLAPVSMTLECNGKTIHFSGASDYERNPCVASHYYELDNFSVYGPGIHYQFVIDNDVIDKWLSVE
ncbi:MAG: hypothetical protein IKX71_02695 [Bacteroidales bacterium]|nr:hypothetical protein [Bacteroidales bacterium]